MSLTRPPQVNSKNFGDKPVLTKSLSDRLNPPSPADGRGSARESVAPFLTVDIVSSTMSCSLTPVETASSMLLCCGEPAVFDACGVASELYFSRGFRRQRPALASCSPTPVETASSMLFCCGQRGPRPWQRGPALMSHFFEWQIDHREQVE